MKYRVTVETMTSTTRETAYNTYDREEVYQQTFEALDTRKLVEFLNLPGVGAPAIPVDDI